MSTLNDLLKLGPLTKTVPTVLERYTIAEIHTAASVIGYTRRAVNHALRKAGVKQNKSRKDVNHE